MFKVLVPLFILILSACTVSSGVVPVGNDKYMISLSEKGFAKTGNGVKLNAMKRANDFCNAKGMQMEPVSSMGQDMKPFRADAQAVVEFKCIK